MLLQHDEEHSTLPDPVKIQPQRFIVQFAIQFKKVIRR